MKIVTIYATAMHLAIAMVSAQNESALSPLALQYKTLEAMHPFAVVQEYDFGYDYDKKGEQLWPLVKCPVKPLIDEPLRDASICRGPDGDYFLTGTLGVFTDKAGDNISSYPTPRNKSGDQAPDTRHPTPDTRHSTPDFQSMLQIKLWRSTDGVNWTPLGTVFDLTDPKNYTHPQKTANRWMQRFNLNPNHPELGMVRGITSPEIHYMKDTFWIVYSMNDQGVGLLKSTTGKPEGPYENVAEGTGHGESSKRLLTRAATPSLFNDNGAVYAVWGEGWIARMKDDMTGLAEEPRLLTVEPNSSLGDYPMTCGRRGAYIFKEKGLYHLVCEDINPRLGYNPCRDVFVATSKNVYGPYGPRQLMIPNAGQVTVFKDGEGRLNASFSGNPRDRYAMCPDRAVIMPLVQDNFLGRVNARKWVRTEGGLVGGLKPCWDVTANEPVKIRDPLVTLEPDGYYYCAGTTGKDKDGMPGARVWRSKDLKHWERIQRPGSDDGFIWSCKQAEWTSKPTMGKTLGYVHHDLWGPQLFKHNNTYWIPFFMFNLRTTSFLKSTTGRPEGPYVNTDFRYMDGAPHLFRDDDGSVYMHFCFGPPRIGKLKDDFSGFETPPRDISYENASRQGFEGTWIIKVGGKYVLFQSERPGSDRLQQIKRKYDTYDWMYTVSDHIMGPYSESRPCIPHGGTGSVFQDKDGNWWAAMFGADTTAPLPCQLSFVPLEIDVLEDDVRVRIADDFPEGHDMTRIPEGALSGIENRKLDIKRKKP